MQSHAETRRRGKRQGIFRVGSGMALSPASGALRPGNTVSREGAKNAKEGNFRVGPGVTLSPGSGVLRPGNACSRKGAKTQRKVIQGMWRIPNLPSLKFFTLHPSLFNWRRPCRSVFVCACPCVRVHSPAAGHTVTQSRISGGWRLAPDGGGLS